ncbi:MAG: hypothetical protein JOY80_12225 [Candidatus Dormibacteraeota bacterium]|nr:hypothetical protein [Candidatus Dormibacteraeota bacterium]
MRRDGLLASKKSGRRALYHLAGAFAGAFERARRPALITPVTWQGSFHAVIYQVPERHRAFRDALRRTAMLSGLGLLQPGLLLALRDPRATLEPVLAVKPPPARVLFTSIVMELEDARGAARTAWALPDLEAVYAGHIKCLRAALSRERAAPAATAETLRRFNRLARDPMSDMLRDPGLPPELLPAAWTGPRLRDALAEVTARFYPPAHTFVVERITSVS